MFLIEKKNFMKKPFINVEAESLPEAFAVLYKRIEEDGVWALKESYAFKTKFDKIKECESRVAISNVLQEPMISQAFPGFMDLPQYVSDVLLGTKDHVIGRPKGYDYTYHDRIFHRVGGPGGQITYVLSKLGEAPYSNRAQATTWIPELDSKLEAPPCLQRIWFKLEDKTLHCETDWRSREFLFAWYENIVGMAGIGLLVRECLRDYFGLEISDEIFYVDRCNSLHVYGKDYNFFKKNLTPILTKGTWAWNSRDPTVLGMWEGKELFSPVTEAKKTVFDPIFK